MRVASPVDKYKALYSKWVARWLTVLPNYLDHLCNLELNGAAQGIITLSDLSGKVIGTYPATTRSIDMRNVANGMYFVTFSDGVNRIAQRVVRQ